MSDTETGSTIKTERPELFFTVAMLHDITNDRYHPIMYKPKPTPGWVSGKGELVRSQSMGHHTEGFDNHVAALISANEVLITMQEQIDNPDPDAKGIPLGNWAGHVFPCLEKSFPWDGNPANAHGNNYFGYDKDGKVIAIM